MSRVKPSKDIQTLSTFRSNAASFVDQVRSTGRPLVLTQHGRSAAVLLDVSTYEDLLEELELLRDVRESQAEFKESSGLSHSEAKKRLRTRAKA